MSSRTPSGRPAKIVSALRRLILIGLVLIIAVLAINLSQRKPKVCQPDSELATVGVEANNHRVVAEVAEEEPDKVRGLSGRECLEENRGMLFPYALTGDYCFWMKDMKFAIDIIWLDDDKKIVTVKDRAAPDTFPQEFCPDKPAQYILEVNAGAAKNYGWQAGTVLSF